MIRSVFISLTLVFSLCASVAVLAEAETPETAQKAVLITGASTGLGRSMTELFASKGHFVYAGARKDSDIAELNAIENVQAVRLDVTVQEDIDAAVETIRSAGRGLHGLINNAGVAVIAPLIEVDEEDFGFQMNVNVYGVYRVTKAFAPLIIESKGRISTTGSISGILSGTLFGPYSMSKHAMEAFTDSLAVEMERFGVQVSVIEPGNYRSDIGKNIARRMKARGITVEDSLYREELERMMGFLDAPEPMGGDPIEVAEAALHAMFDENPKRRYMVVPNERQAEITVRKAMEEMVQLNQGQKYSYDRDTLIRMLDELLAAHP
ncbi:MAG: SDR family oxidoreductase [Gammaproteobacteria bacterium]|nr:SDR family oxidoreductase [Gammaproteobacteria bacterium]